MLYLWIKAVHIIAAISWMAMLLYLPRLMVYHCQSEAGSTQSETFKIMERRLLKAIGTPAMMLTWVLGLYMIIEGGHLSSGQIWPYAKIICVVALTGFHIRFSQHVKSFAEDSNTFSDRYFRWINEMPAVLMVVIVVLVVVKPI